MSDVVAVVQQMERAIAELERDLASAEAWHDNQRHRLNRGRIEPLLLASRQYRAALSEVDVLLSSAEATLGRA